MTKTIKTTASLNAVQLKANTILNEYGIKSSNVKDKVFSLLTIGADLEQLTSNIHSEIEDYINDIDSNDYNDEFIDWFDRENDEIYIGGWSMCASEVLHNCDDYEFYSRRDEWFDDNKYELLQEDEQFNVLDKTAIVITRLNAEYKEETPEEIIERLELENQTLRLENDNFKKDIDMLKNEIENIKKYIDNLKNM